MRDARSAREQAPGIGGDAAGVELCLLDPLGGARERHPAARKRPAVEHHRAPPDRALEPIQLIGLEVHPTGVAADHLLEPRLAGGSPQQEAK
jgi:hypothetical protein